MTYTIYALFYLIHNLYMYVRKVQHLCLSNISVLQFAKLLGFFSHFALLKLDGSNAVI